MNVKSRSGKRSSKRSVLDDSNIISIIVARTFVLVWVLCGGLMITIVEGLTIPPGLKLSSRIQLIRNGNGNEESILGRGIWARRGELFILLGTRESELFNSRY